mmetsp:Transcript_5392/g.8377  ORF Transcript_5392/g.8377 Transcript_5392/m.8377 type:complete len:92 (+) Transcript_5392:179-454(+)
MVCPDCEKKQTSVICPEPWKAGARSENRNPTKTNKLLDKKRYTPYSAKCKVCKSLLHQGGVYCVPCAYKSGFCALCGVKIIDTKFYKQSSK